MRSTPAWNIRYITTKTIQILFFILLIITAVLQKPASVAKGFTFTANINKQFTPISIVAGGISVLEITIYNPNTFELENASFIDNLVGIQPGLFVATPNGLVNECGGTVVANAGGTTVTLSGGTVPPQVGPTPGSCSIFVNVSSTTPGNLINRIPPYSESPSNGSVGLYSTANSGLDIITNTTEANATLRVDAVQAPSLSKSFNPTTVWVGQSSLLTIRLANNDPDNSLTQATYTDTLPSPFVVASPSNATTSNCGSATLSAVTGSNTITLSNATIAPTGTCQVQVRVVSGTQGAYTNTIPAGPAGTGSVRTLQGVTNATAASANINVQSVGISKAFSPATIQQGDTSLLTITLRNPTGANYNNMDLTDNLPAGVTVSSAPASPQCGGVISYTASSIHLEDGVIPAGNVTTPGTCTITVRVTSTTVGTRTNTLAAGALTGDITNAFPASANLVVQTRVIGVTKAFGGQIIVGGTTSLVISLQNSASTTLTGVDFTDAMPTNLTVVGTPILSPSCGGSATVINNGTSITVNDAVIPAGAVGSPGICTITASVTAAVPGSYTNSIPAGTVTSDQGVVNSFTSSTAIAHAIGGDANVAKSFSPTTIAANGSSLLTITITAPADTGLTGISISDTLPGDLVIASSPAGTTSCAGGMLTATPGTKLIQLTGGAISTGGGSCNIRVYVTSGTTGSYVNQIPGGTLITSEGRTEPTLRTATLNVTEFSISKSFSPSVIAPNGNSRLTIYLTNKALIDLTNVTLTDSLASMGGNASNGVFLAADPDPETTCGSGTVGATAGTQTITLSNGTVPASDGVVPGLCSVSVTVQGIGIAANRTNTLVASNVTGDLVGIMEDVHPVASVTADLEITGLTIQVNKGFAPTLVYGNSTSKLTIELSNSHSVPLTGIEFTDTMPAGMILAAIPAFDTDTCGGTLTGTPGSNVFTYEGGTLAASSTCELTMNVTMDVIDNRTNTIPIGAVTTFEGASNTDATSASLTNLAGASLSKSFTPNPVVIGQTSILTITITNTSNVAITGMGLVDNLPTTPAPGLVIASSPASSTTCDITSGSLTAVAGETAITLVNASLPGSSSCTISVPVVSSSPNSYLNVIPAGGLVTSGGGTNEVPATDTLVVTGYSIGNRVWDDNGAGGGVTADGLMNGSEPGLSGVTVRLYLDAGNDGTPDGSAIATTTTDSSGYYRFDNLINTHYIVEVVYPTGYISSPIDGGDPDLVVVDKDDNGVDTSPGTAVRSNSITLGPSNSEPTGETDPATNPLAGEPPDDYSNRTVDFGLFKPYSLGNRVWNDNGAGGGTANNGIQDGTETGISGVTVRLYRDHDDNGTPDSSAIAFTLTDASGYYRFDDLISDTYIVEVAIPTGYRSSVLDAGDPNDDLDDLDDNGVVYSGNNIRSNPITLSGTQPITDNDPSTNPVSGESPNDLSNRTVDFGLVATYSLGNRVWNDNGTGTGGAADNGLQDGSEPGVSGVTVEVYSGTTPSGSPVATTVTDGNGYYRFDNLFEGQYVVSITLPAGYASSTGGDSSPDNGEDLDDNGVNAGTGTVYTQTINLGPGASEPTAESDPSTNPLAGEAPDAYSNRTIDFGLTFVPYSVGNRVWSDNGAGGAIANDGWRTDDEPGLANVTVRIYRDTDSDGTPDGYPVDSMLTDSDGYYRFDGLAEGTYILEAAIPTGYFSSQTSESNPNANVDNNDNGDAVVGSYIRTGRVNLGPAGLEPTGETDPTDNPLTGEALDNNSNRTVDFGFTPYASVGDRVWYDSDQDGIQDSGEAGLLGVTVTLYDSGNAVVGTTTTTGGGLYRFNNLMPGNYYLDFTPPADYTISTQDAGSDDTLDSDINTGTGETAQFTLVAGQYDSTRDAGMYQDLASIGNKVWLDTNRDGVQDGGEVGINGVAVAVYRPGYGPDGIPATADDDTAIQTTTTAGNGDYLFASLLPGDYYIAVTLPSAYAFTTRDAGGDNALDSDVYTATGLTTTTTLSAGEYDDSWDAGLYQLASIGDRVWNDLDMDGVQDGGESGINGVLVTLYTDTGSVVASATTTTIGGNPGSYLFSNLEPGDYYLEFATPAGTSPTVQDSVSGTDETDSDLNTSTGRTVTTTLSSGENDLTWDAGFYPLASVGNYVWDDLDLDGIQDASEPGFANVTVTLYASGGGLIATTTTAADGSYLFSNLEPGDYYLDFTAPYGYAFTATGQGTSATDSDADSNSGETGIINLSPNEYEDTWDAGLYKLYSSIGDRVWVDMNGDGIQNGGETGLGLVVVDLNDSIGNFLQTTTTDGNGNYSFTGLEPDYYSIKFHLPTGYRVTVRDQGADDALDSDADLATYTTNLTELIPGENDMTWDMGLVQPASIGDTVWLDRDADGEQDAGEPGLPSVYVELYRVGAASRIAEDTTDANGNYLFTDLIPGDYYVDFTIPSGFQVSPIDAGSDDEHDSDVNAGTGATDQFNLPSNGSDLSRDLGLYEYASLGDLVWLDTNGNGIQDGGDTALAGVTVELLDSDDNVINSTTTDSTGNYAFTNLVPGDYSIKVTAPGGYEFTLQNQGGDDTLDSDVDRTNGKTSQTTLISGENDTSWDAGLYRPASIGDLVWLDVNGNGVQEGGELGYGGVTVNLYNASNNLVDTAVTDGAGLYDFTGLIPGSYYLEFVPPSGYAITLQDQGGADASDSDAAISNGRTTPTNLVSDEDDMTWDVGIYIPATLGDRVWEDMDDNGIQDDGEPGIAGVTVNLYDTSDHLVQTQTTDANGNYLFTNLLPAVYYVDFVPPTEYIFTDVDQTDDTKDSDANPSSGLTATTSLDSDEDDLTWDAGLYRVTTLGDYVWNDPNINGVQDAGETGIADVSVTLHAVDAGTDEILGTSDDVDIPGSTTTTDANGYYQFTNLDPGNYYVVFTLPSGYVFSQPDRGGNDAADSDADRTTGRTPTTVLTSNEADLTLDAGMYSQIARVGVAKRVVGTPTKVSAGTWQITYEILIRNYSNVDLTDIRATDAFSATFPTTSPFSVVSITSSDFAVNSAFTGQAGGLELIDTTDPTANQLAIGEEGTITVVIEVVPANYGPFNNSAIATGQPELGERIADSSQNGTNPDPDSNNDPTDNNEPTPVDFGPNLFDPPYGVKLLDTTGYPRLRWVMDWINDTNIVAINATAADEIPVGAVFFDNGYDNGTLLPSGLPDGSTTSGVSCTQSSSVTVTTACYYEGPTEAYPRGRIIWQGTLGPDFGITDPETAVNDIQISFIVDRVNGVRAINNTATIDADLNGDLDTLDPGEQQVASASASWLAPRLPDTGFAPDQVTLIPEQPSILEYTNVGDIRLVIPALGVDLNVTGVPVVNGEYDLTWLGNQAGYLEGTAFPTHAGNSVITGHVYLPDGKPGPFVDLNRLKFGDQIIIHAYGQKYIYQVTTTRQVSPDDRNAITSEAYPVITLLTCRGYDEDAGTYQWRYMVTAIQIKVEDE